MSRHRPSVGPASVRIWAVLGLAVILLSGVTVLRADAGIRGENSLVWPATAAVGTTFSASLVILNQSTFPTDTEDVTLESFFVTPACASASFGICLGPDTDPGVFDVLTAVGDAGTAPCAGVTFSVRLLDPISAEVLLIPSSTITLGPANGPAPNRTCQVDLTLHVNKLPANPDSGIPGRTNALSQVVLRGIRSQLKSPAIGSALITVTPELLLPPPVPTLSGWVMIMLAVFLVLVGTVALRGRTV